MAPGPDNYRGAVSLSASIYASPQRKAQFQAFPLAISSPVAANGTIATKEQIAASNGSTSTDLSSYNSDAQLAMAQNEALKEQVDKHSASFNKSVYSAMNNTRDLLTLVRESIKKDSPTAASELATVHHIWVELERLSEAVKEAKNALPTFLEKQKDNMSLYHNSAINETMRESQAELDLQHKKINLQHSLILEHQQAFQDYKATTDPKLGQLKALEQQVSRLTLDKGLVKQQFTELQEELERFKFNKVEGIKKLEDLHKEINSLLTAKNSLSDETSTLRKALSELQDKIKVEQQQAIDRYDQEVRQKTEQIAKEEQKAADLQKLVSELKNRNCDTQNELNEQIKTNKAQQEKFDNLSRAHAKAFNEVREKDKKISSLTVDIEHLQKQMTNITAERANKLNDAHKEIAHVADKVKRLEKLNDELEIENNDLTAKAEETKKGLMILRNENAKLSADLKELQSKPATNGAGTAVSILTEELEATKKELAQSKASVDEWVVLAKRAYQEYKDMLPTYKEAEENRSACVEKDKEIATLKNDLSTAKTQSNQSNGVSGDAAYWKDRYESLLATIG